ncbi:hypothetical protein M422DRAFT_29082 [Sphaerobolus stellatus SS14]|uniref:Unplaced genomic scaffold SPHSTscaffold_542, whole genome shotgun sequence n=1 Tax=Sphaerobolus stellatus (strain SS14) TaxID=990650 RepID=A0A0C9TP16_SPHS4|nr:hypothetical protein M422DRAFT_39516 [Sphaerobolus stellatus SS14]KIJ46893.1 hypothetical protein M422DRAFT_29082 [Sphaerobolus stellatus SS14]
MARPSAVAIPGEECFDYCDWDPYEEGFRRLNFRNSGTCFGRLAKRHPKRGWRYGEYGTMQILPSLTDPDCRLKHVNEHGYPILSGNPSHDHPPSLDL